MTAPTFQIPNDVIKPILEAHVAAAVSQALDKDHQRLIAGLVSEVLNRRVNDRGEPASYDTKRSYLLWLLEDVVRTAIKEAVIEQLGAYRPHLAAAIAKELRNPKAAVTAKLIEAMASSVTAERFWSRLQVSLASE